MTKVYGKCHEEIGAFNDTKYIVGMLDRVRLVGGCVRGGVVRALAFHI